MQTMSVSARGSTTSNALPDAAFLKLAIAVHRGRMVEALRANAFSANVHLELAVSGVPGVRRVALFAWPEPLGPARRVAVDVVRLDEEALRAPICFSYELEDWERPAAPPVEVTIAELALEIEGRRIVATGTAERPVRWTQILAGEARREHEVQQLDRSGGPVFATVDTSVYSYRMTCACGRVRYSKPNSLHQIFACRVCTRFERLRKRALRQYRARYGKKR